MVLILRYEWLEKRYANVFQLRTNKKVNFNVFSGKGEITCKAVSAPCKFELESTAMTSLQRLKEWGRDWQRDEERERKNSSEVYFIYHHLPRATLAACTVNMSSGRAAAKMLETTSRLWLTPNTHIPARMQETHTWMWVYKLMHTITSLVTRSHISKPKQVLYIITTKRIQLH